MKIWRGLITKRQGDEIVTEITESGRDSLRRLYTRDQSSPANQVSRTFSLTVSIDASSVCVLSRKTLEILTFNPRRLGSEPPLQPYPLLYEVCFQ